MYAAQTQLLFKDKERFEVPKYRKRYTMIIFYPKKAGIARLNSDKPEIKMDI